MRSTVTSFFCPIVLFTLVITVPALGAPRLIPLVDAARDAVPTLELAERGPDGCRVTVRIDALQVEDLEIDGRTWQVLGLVGGGLEGQPGAAALPNTGGLLAVPVGHDVSVKATVRSRETITGIRPLPFQPEDAQHFVWDEADYAKSGTDQAEVTVGTAAIMHGVRLVPFTVHPVRYDGDRGAITVATELDLEFSFAPAGGGAAKSAGGQLTVGRSFARLFEDMVLNWPPEHVTINEEPGTWLCIYPDDTGLADALAPLAEWRRQQGYHVMLDCTLDIGGPTAYAVKNHIRNVYNFIEPKLENVCLVGDANGTVSLQCWYEGYSGYNGETDHEHATVDGDDSIADVHIGRLSCRTVAELEGIVTKIVNYETAPPMTDLGWFTRATVVGDPNDSGMTTVYVAQWVKSHLERIGYTQVDTIWNSPFASRMYASVNQGVSAFAYRGYYGVSGFSTGYIDNLTNGGELAFAVLPTCESGSFSDMTHCWSEAFLRNPQGGAVGAIGTATPGTHTRYNNCYFGGVWEGILNTGDRHLGAAHTRGKLELWRQYEENEPNIPQIWSCWNNLMGDPATEMWQAIPESPLVDHPDALPVGAGSLPVTVSGVLGPVANARVCAYRSSEVRSVGTTDSAGHVTLALDAPAAGNLTVTVTGTDLLPYQGTVTVGAVDAFAEAEDWTADDTASGNGDGIANPSESLALVIGLRNLGSEATGAVTLSLVSEDPWTVADPTPVAVGDIPAGALVSCPPCPVQVAPDAPDGAVATLRVTATAGTATWVSRVELPVTAAVPVVANTDYGPNSPAPGETGTLTVTVRNDGPRAVAGGTATLTPLSPFLLLFGPAVQNLDPLAPGGTVDVSYDILVREDCHNNHQGALALEVLTAEGSVHLLTVTLTVGSLNVYAPTGPDAYGYIGFDDQDPYSDAPTYDWVELDPAQGGVGTDVGLTDFGYEQDDTRTVDLPFVFRYYGQDYDQLSICSNGWASFGATSLCEFFNWGIPCAGVPRPLLAVFWDDLVQSGTNRVYHWYDDVNSRYVVQWSRMRTALNGLNNCELILYDPVAHPTLTGDGLIEFQYQYVDNNDDERGYCTVGIQNPDGTDGILWTYYNDYERTSRSLQANRAIAFVPTLSRPAFGGAVAPTQLSFDLETGQTAIDSLTVSTTGETGTVFSWSVAPAGEEAWLIPVPAMGQVPGGQSATITVTVDATELGQGSYDAELVISHNTGDPITVPVSVLVSPTTAAPEGVPTALSLASVHPNPFNPRCEIRFALPAAGQVTLTVYDATGRRVATPVRGAMPAGHHTLTWDGTDESGRRLASGAYLLRLEANGEARTRKAVLVK